MDDIYARYANYIDKNFNLETFKSNQDYTYMLEHVLYNQGLEYYDLLINECKFNNTQIIDFCSKNDSIGNPVKHNIRGIICSTTSLRYLYHAYRILFLLNDTNNIIEVGGGYGGLCLAIDYLSNIFNIKVESYTIIDLDQANKVQREYLSKFNLSFKVNILSAFNYTNFLDRNDYFLVSNYCISEISASNRAMYASKLLPNIKRGFMTWNEIDFDFDMFNKFNVTIETERPLTGKKNLYVILTENTN